MPRARLVDPRRAVRSAIARRRAEGTIRHLRALARVARRLPGEHGKRMRALLSNGAWAVEEIYGMHPEGED